MIVGMPSRISIVSALDDPIRLDFLRYISPFLMSALHWSHIAALLHLVSFTICPLMANINGFTTKKPQLRGFDGLAVGLSNDDQRLIGFREVLARNVPPGCAF